MLLSFNISIDFNEHFRNSSFHVAEDSVFSLAFDCPGIRLNTKDGIQPIHWYFNLKSVDSYHSYVHIVIHFCWETDVIVTESQDFLEYGFFFVSSRMLTPQNKKSLAN